MKTIATLLLVVVSLALVHGGFLNDIKNGVENGIDSIKNGVENEIDSIKNGVENGIYINKNAVENGIDSIRIGVEDGVDSIRIGVEDGIDSISNGVQNGIDSIKNGINSNNRNAVENGIGSIRHGVENGIGSIRHGVENGIASIKNGVQNGINSIRNGINSNNRNAVQNGIDSIRNGIETGIDSIRNGIETGIDSIRNGIDTGIDSIRNGIDSNNRNAIENGIGSIRHGVENGIGSIRHGVENGIASIRHGVENGIASIRNGEENGIDSIKNWVENGMESIRNGVENEINSIRNGEENGIVKFLGKNGQQPESIFGHITGDNRAHLFTDIKTADIYLNVPQLLTKNGYPVESYVVETEDGYLITLHRIPHGKNKPDQPSKNVVVLFRALFCNTYEYLFLGPEKAIGYTLADMGYDVWMVEMRGNSYSKAHVKLQPNNAEFWDMSWDDMGTYDVPAAINFVLNKTGVDKVFVGGHSMGTTALFVGLSVHPWLNEKVRVMIALGPVAFTAHVGGPLGLVGKVIPEMAWNLVPYQSVLPLTVIDILRFLGKTVCGTQLTAVFCTLVISVADGNEFGNLNSTAFPTMIAHIPESDSTKNVAHYLQGVKSGKFQRYDYGSVGNMKKYGRNSPTEYDLSKVTAPVALFASEGDLFGGTEDSKTLASKLPNVVLLDFTKDKGFRHIDFAFGNNAPEQVYQHVYSIMKKY